MDFQLDRMRQIPKRNGWITTRKFLRLEGEYLVYRDDDVLIKFPSDRLIWAFIRLADASPKQMAAFARKWGVLGIKAELVARNKAFCEYAESVITWRNLASRFRALVRISAEINEGKTGLAKDWKLLGKPPASVGSSIDAARLELWLHLMTLVDRFQVRPFLFWEDSRWQISLDSPMNPNTPAILTLQLIRLMEDINPHVNCTGCGEPYRPARAPSRGRDRYCPACHKNNTMWRLIKRKQRFKLRHKHLSEA